MRGCQEALYNETEVEFRLSEPASLSLQTWSLKKTFLCLNWEGFVLKYNSYNSSDLKFSLHGLLTFITHYAFPGFSGQISKEE